MLIADCFKKTFEQKKKFYKVVFFATIKQYNYTDKNH